MLDQIPDGSRVAASDDLGSRIALRTDLYLVGDTIGPDGPPSPASDFDDVEWIAFDTGSPSAPVPAWRGFAASCSRAASSRWSPRPTESSSPVASDRRIGLPDHHPASSVRAMEPTCRACLVYDESLTSYDFGPTHPMNPIRVDLTVALADGLGVLDHLPLVPPPTPPRTTSPPSTSPP